MVDHLQNLSVKSNSTVLNAIGLARHISLLELPAAKMKALKFESKLFLYGEFVVVMYPLFSKITSSVMTALRTAGSMFKFRYSLIAGEFLYSVPRFIA